MAPNAPRSLLPLVALLFTLLAGCGAPPPADPIAAAPPSPVSRPAATATASPPQRPSPTPAPSATLAPATATPAPTLALATATPDPDAPPRVGLQVGHWKIEEHPEEQIRLRKFSGAYYGGYDEWELNILIAEEVQRLLEAAGVTVELLPATVPVGYQADLFVSIHVDGVTGDQAATRRGWKVATPFGASRASEALAAAIATSYPAATGLPADPQGPSYDMRAYYAFAAYRYWHSVAPTTPAVIVECGFMTHPADREVLFEQTERVGAGIAEGILAYLQEYHPAGPDMREPRGLAMVRPAAADVPLYARADVSSAVQLTLDRDQPLVQVARADGWRLVFTHGDGWELGWLRESDVEILDEAIAPPHPCCGE